MATSRQKRQNRRKRSLERAEARIREQNRPRTDEEVRALEEKMARSWQERFSYRVRGHAQPLTFTFSGIPVPFDETDPGRGLLERTEESPAMVPRYRQ